jgi:hypothetical protein
MALVMVRVPMGSSRCRYRTKQLTLLRPGKRRRLIGPPGHVSEPAPGGRRDELVATVEAPPSDYGCGSTSTTCRYRALTAPVIAARMVTGSA